MINKSFIVAGLRQFDFEDTTIPFLAVGFEKDGTPSIVFSDLGLEIRKQMDNKEIGEVLIQLGKQLIKHK